MLVNTNHNQYTSQIEMIYIRIQMAQVSFPPTSGYSSIGTYPEDHEKVDAQLEDTNKGARHHPASPEVHCVTANMKKHQLLPPHIPRLQSHINIPLRHTDRGSRPT
ncbi:unnamed protein product [Somion occarium]|uniref:Uncharacterized protein n=1 Tax=Somion occarium TaxID=3059160 RepID=A0ABP1E144_9APHY